MPHIVIECSDNVGRQADMPALVKRIHRAVLGTGVFPIGGTRTRLSERSIYEIADGAPENGFVHVTMRIAAGRDAETKHRAASAIFDELCAALEPLYERMPLGISLEMVELDPALSFKKNNLHEYVEERKAAKV